VLDEKQNYFFDCVVFLALELTGFLAGVLPVAVGVLAFGAGALRALTTDVAELTTGADSVVDVSTLYGALG
jgi:hypothetical protein